MLLLMIAIGLVVLLCVVKDVASLWNGTCTRISSPRRGGMSLELSGLVGTIGQNQLIDKVIESFDIMQACF